MQTVAWLMAFSAAPFGAAGTSFDGSWQGTGLWARDSLERPAATAEHLEIDLSPTQLRFQECWVYRDTDGRQKSPCIDSTYERVGESLFHNGKKVGDLFPNKIQIYDGNTQVSEQITIQETSTGVLYRYSYLNFDGAAERREAKLRRVDGQARR